MDVNVNTNMKQSEINGLFNEVEVLKNQRKKDMDLVKKKTEKIIDHIIEHGNVLAYKDNVPHILTVKNGSTRKFDKASLATDMDMTQKELDVIGIAELVEEDQVTSEKLEEYFYDEPTQNLKARKAKPSDMDLLRSSGRI